MATFGHTKIQIEERKHTVDIEICTETHTLHGLALSYIECQKDRDRRGRVRTAVFERGFQQEDFLNGKESHLVTASTFVNFYWKERNVMAEEVSPNNVNKTVFSRGYPALC